MQPGISTHYRYFCSTYMFIELGNKRYKKITNTSYLSDFEEHLNRLEKSPNESVNARVLTLIHYANGNIDTLCIGEYRGICLNGDLLLHDEDFHNLIMDEIDFYDKKLYEKLRKK
ncbi:hypothetical protein [Kordia antarctica]|nr:hypothetical protein [Kordia antarctica]